MHTDYFCSAEIEDFDIPKLHWAGLKPGLYNNFILHLNKNQWYC
jgi:hypothetical protein